VKIGADETIAAHFAGAVGAVGLHVVLLVNFDFGFVFGERCP